MNINTPCTEYHLFILGAFLPTCRFEQTAMFMLWVKTRCVYSGICVCLAIVYKITIQMHPKTLKMDHHSLSNQRYSFQEYGLNYTTYDPVSSDCSALKRKFKKNRTTG